jgi:hypothetical protein
MANQNFNKIFVQNSTKIAKIHFFAVWFAESSNVETRVSTTHNIKAPDQKSTNKIIIKLAVRSHIITTPPRLKLARSIKISCLICFQED